MNPIRSIASLLCATLLLSPVANAASPQQPVPSSSAAQQPAPSTGPVPSQIAAAHNVFLTNSVADPNFPVDTTRAYNDIYALLKSWGRYQLVSSPAQADLVFQLRDIAPITNVTGNNGSVYSLTSPAFQLTILDPKTNVAIWTVTSPVDIVEKKKVYDHWVSISETNLVSRLKVLAGQPLSATETTDLTTFPANHGLKTALIVTAAVVGVGVGGGLLLHHLYENSLASQKAKQDAFCEANNIPLSECAGG